MAQRKCLEVWIYVWRKKEEMTDEERKKIIEKAYKEYDETVAKIRSDSEYLLDDSKGEGYESPWSMANPKGEQYE